MASIRLAFLAGLLATGIVSAGCGSDDNLASPSARVQEETILTGKVRAIDPVFFHLDAADVLTTDQTLYLSPNDRVVTRGAFRVGDVVRVKGVRNADGTLTALQIRTIG